MKNDQNVKTTFKIFFKNNKYPSKSDIIDLKQQTGIDEKKISAYFAQLRFQDKRTDTKNCTHPQVRLFTFYNIVFNNHQIFYF